MRKWMLAAAMAVAVCVNAAGQVAQGQAVAFKYEHDGVLAARLYRDGVLLKQFALSEITPLATNVVTGGVTYTFKVTLAAGLPRGLQTITARVVEADGTESDDSNALVVKVKPKAPWNFSLW